MRNIMTKKQKITLSTLPHTWILDLDGSIVEHNAYKTGNDVLLKGAKEFLNSIPDSDYIIILTAREKESADKTINFLKNNNVRYDKILFEIPVGERILLNDKKTSGLECAHIISPKRNEGLENIEICIDYNL